MTGGGSRPSEPTGDIRGSAAAIRRSLDIYYRDAARIRRMDALNAQFVPKGGLAFDIGAHVGDRTASFLRLGARVVALEPQPRVFRALRLIHGRTAGVHLHRAAIGAETGEIELFLNTQNPTVSTVSKDLIVQAGRAETWQGQNWSQSITVPVRTLDDLIARHGRPDFVKIDVEGHEAEALTGLTTALPALSFEFTTIQKPVAHACLDRLQSLGSYMFNLSLGEGHRLSHATWRDEAEIRAELDALPMAANSGDIYARRM